ncbi:hypothetical protein LCER1_G008826 [Lachnellula cervina]|uniref:N-acetyltransferase domain-containing protein n=1 Tax=Lachnellula cervina TaxID=1316786 RepID=A0A7D8UJC9_9HELO|nr:hypothetical protein LCER1_G008826 [Lachnellula cervina]
MPLHIRPATLSDAAAITEIYLSAFNNNAISLLAFPRDNPASYNWWYDSIIEEFADPHAHFLCIYDSLTSTSTSTSSSPPSQPSIIVAFAKWVDAETPPQSTAMPKWPEGGDHAIADRFFGTLARKHGEVMGGRRHWYLEALATRPEWQGRGAAGMLMRWGLSRVDEEGTEAYLEASPHGKPVYEHFGFREVDRLVLGLEGEGEEVLGEREFVECFMVRGVVGKEGK